MIRSLIFNILFYGVTAIMVTIGVPVLLFPTFVVVKYANLWAGVLVFLLKHIIGMRHRIKGMRPDHPVIYAAKHQSAWETIVLYAEFGNPAPVLKKELVYLPFIGLFFLKIPSVPIDRSAGRSALKNLMVAAAKIKSIGGSILIFPQGTRTAPGATPRDVPYHSGTFAIYQATGLPVVPVALNSGLFWSRAAFTKRPGMIDVELLAEIPPGLNRHDFMTRLEEAIETASNQLPGMAEAAKAKAI
jgi:1-acyl-sn-glycerol-3-phosphate acyltransferase